MKVFFPTKLSVIFHLYNEKLPPSTHNSMTGVGGRPEVVVEGRVDQLWKEYEFYYKPGNINKMPPFVGL